MEMHSPRKVVEKARLLCGTLPVRFGALVYYAYGSNLKFF